MIRLDRTMLSPEMIEAASAALANEPPLFGESITRFEEEFARFCGSEFAVSVASGTDALIFSMMACGLEGKKALTTPSSYVATANAAFHARGEPVFCDIDPSTNNIDPLEIEKAIKRTKKAGAIVPVHLHGYPARMDWIMEIAEKKGVPVIEDAAQAHGAVYSGRRAGSMGITGCFSFHPAKNMTVGGEAGMVVTNDEKIAKKIRMLADAGRENPYTHEHALLGFTSRMNTVNAAIGLVQLRNLESWNEDRRWVAGEYRRRLKGLGIILPPEEEGVVPVYNKFAIKLSVLAEREALRDFLYNEGIESDAHYPIPIHLQPPYRKMGYRKGDFPMAEKFADTTLSLPLYVGMDSQEIGIVCDKIREFLGK